MKNTLEILKHMKHAANHYNIIGYEKFHDSPKVKENKIMDDFIVSMLIKEFYVKSFFNNAQKMENMKNKNSKVNITRPITEILLMIISVGIYFIFSLFLISILKLYITPTLNVFFLSLPFIFSFKFLILSIFKKVEKTIQRNPVEEYNLTESIQKTTQNLNADLDMIRLLIAGGNCEYAFIEEEINYLDSYINQSSDFFESIKPKMIEEINLAKRVDYFSLYDKTNISFKKISKEKK